MIGLQQGNSHGDADSTWVMLERQKVECRQRETNMEAPDRTLNDVNNC